MVREDYILWKEGEGGGGRRWWPYVKYYLEGRTKRPSPLWTEIEGSKKAALELKEVMGEKVFNHPKPTDLIRRLLEIVPDPRPGDIYLDSFAGSGTTGHAVLLLNKEDGLERRFVLVQQPFDASEDKDAGRNICRTVTSERLRRVIRAPRSRKRVKDSPIRPVRGSFTYARVGLPLLGDHRSWGERMPAYDELARYIFFTETETELDQRKGDRKTGKIGEHAGASYYLLYTPDPAASVPLDQKVLDALAKDRNPRKVVYCEKVWVHREDLAKMRREIGEVRTMLLPFQVRAS